MHVQQRHNDTDTRSEEGRATDGRKVHVQNRHNDTIPPLSAHMGDGRRVPVHVQQRHYDTATLSPTPMDT